MDKKMDKKERDMVKNLSENLISHITSTLEIKNIDEHILTSIVLCSLTVCVSRCLNAASDTEENLMKNVQVFNSSLKTQVLKEFKG